MPMLTLDHVSIAFGHVPLLDDVALQIERGERVSVIGRNGTGKSTLLQVLAGTLEPDRGTIWREPGLRAAHLVQDVPLSTSRTVFDVVAEGLGDLSAIVTAYHHAAHDVAEHGTPELLEELGRLQHELEERDGWRVEERIEMILARLQLDGDAHVDTLSGGWRRRVLLARALVASPDLLLLDEPTNHLDIDAIAWLETFLSEFEGTVVFVTHDRAFLQRLATRIVELDRGHLTSWPGDYETFLEKKDAWLTNESTANEQFDKRLAEEEVWLRRGVKARRTRDEGRVKALMAMRQERAARRQPVGSVRMRADTADRSGNIVFDAEHVSMAYDERQIVSDFSTRVMRGDRVGLIGPNGTGKTTLLRLLLGDLKPQTGEVHHGTNVQVAYYDQQREQLDPERSVFETVGDGNDHVILNGQPRHVHGYLADFLFPPERMQTPVRALSGGERNRLLLARLFTKPANVLVLDEPTNDLDLETLELLEAWLMKFAGTILLVSHDRAFLDHVVTSTFVFDGKGHVEEFVGGYSDWVRQAAEKAAPRPAPVQVKPKPVKPPAPTPVVKAPAPRKKLSFKDQKEFDALPARIEQLESDVRRFEALVADPSLYTGPKPRIEETLGGLASAQAALAQAYARWDELDSKKKP